MEDKDGKKQTSRARKAAMCDVNGTRKEFLVALPEAGVKLLIAEMRDPRDKPLLYLFANVVMFTIPTAALVYFLPPNHWMGLAYVCTNYALFLQRFALALHYAEHNKLFKKDSHFEFLNRLPSVVLCPLFGIPAGMYRLHHVIMHHVENNQFPLDASSTEPYQRDNVWHFVQYLFKYMVGGWFVLPIYAAKKKLWSLLGEVLAVEAVYLVLVYSLYQHNHVATTWVFIVPFCITSFALMFGNWSQHVFIDPKAPQNCYRMTYNCINCADNQKTFNDGYHIIHHLNSKLHWTQLPIQFMETIEKHIEEGALVFEGIGFFDVGLAVFTGRLDWLADRCVFLQESLDFQDKDSLKRIMRERLKPIVR